MKGTRPGLWQWSLAIYLLFRPKATAKILGTMIKSCTSSAARLRGFFTASSSGFAVFSLAMTNWMCSFYPLSILLLLLMHLCEHYPVSVEECTCGPLGELRIDKVYQLSLGDDPGGISPPRTLSGAGGYISSSQSPLSACGENCACSLAPSLSAKSSILRGPDYGHDRERTK